MFSLYKKFHMPSSIMPLVIAKKMRIKYTFRAAAVLLQTFYKHYLKCFKFLYDPLTSKRQAVDYLHRNRQSVTCQ
jgi:hypothetical protein